MGVSVISLCFSIISLLAGGSEAQTANGCGVAPLNTRVVGGTNAQAGSWPWQVSMHYSGNHMCGGTLIHQEWVLTAAHCMISTVISRWTLYLGRLSQGMSNPNEVTRGVLTFIIHPSYNNTLYNNDVSLIRLSAPVTFNNYIWPICLASGSSTFYNATSCWATGWGKIGKNVPLPAPQTLQEVAIPIVGSRQCSCMYKAVRGALITAQMVCAGRQGKGICQGDSGGPLQCQLGSVWIQAGVTSYGVPCATAGFPEVYARVSEFQSWITQNVAGSSIGFVTFSSIGSDSDSSFTCSNLTVSSAAARPDLALSRGLFILLSLAINLKFLLC